MSHGSLAAECTAASRSETGQVTAGYIKLACSMIPALGISRRFLLFENRKALFDSDPRTGSEDGELYVIRMARLPHRVEQFLVVKATDASR
jgi:hypothetical protein